MDTTTQKHTPTPWNLHRHYAGDLMAVPEGDGHGAFVAASLIIAKGDKFIADVKMQTSEVGWPHVESEQEFRANASHIVHCVNSHDQLVAALEVSRGNVNSLCGTNPAAFSKWLEVIDAALAAAKQA